MSGAAAQIVDTAPSAPAPVSSGDGDALTPAERAYFESRGEVTDGLVPDAPKAAPAPANDAGRRAAPTPDAPSEAGEEGEPVDGEITFDAAGNARNAKTGQFVPKSAFLRVKGEAKEAKTQAQQLRDNLIAAKERLAILTEAAAPVKAEAAPPDDTPIDPEVDLFGAFKQAMKKVAALEEQVKESRTQTQAERESRAIQSTFESDARRFKSQAPDFEAAVQYLVNQRTGELAAVGVSDAQQRSAMVAREAQDLIANAVRERTSPAELLYRIAQARGYNAKTEAPSLEKAAQELEKIAKNQAANVSMRGVGQGGVQESLTLEKYLNSSEDDGLAMRDSYIAKHGKDAWQRFLGKT